MTTLTLRKCKTCGEEKELDKFYTNDGRTRKSCKHCYNKQTTRYRNDNREKYLTCGKKYRKETVGNIADYYVRAQLKKAVNGKEIMSDIPDQLIDVKRLQITLHRLIQKKILGV